ncbi:DUF2238 domain-containing protein [Amycolatopsis suaedae]|nr:DUF2238 domain-containing protein [Amycolatopsis suaedae]
MPTVRGVSPAEGRVLVGVTVAGLVLSAIAPKSYGTWALEVIWVLAGLPLVLFYRKRFPLTRLLCWLLVFHALVLCYGGHYTYAETPLGAWFQEWLGTSRNHYDRFAHVVQGFVPAIAVRELLLRLTPLGRGWTAFLAVCVCATISVGFELVEWGAALALGGAATDFLGTQGDIWDTQWDMFLCVCGALLALLLLRRVHDRQLDAAVQVRQ